MPNKSYKVAADAASRQEVGGESSFAEMSSLAAAGSTWIAFPGDSTSRINLPGTGDLGAPTVYMGVARWQVTGEQWDDAETECGSEGFAVVVCSNIGGNGNLYTATSEQSWNAYVSAD